MRTPLRFSVLAAALAVASLAFGAAPAGAQALRLGAMQPLTAKQAGTAAFPIENVQYRRGPGRGPGRGWVGRPMLQNRGWVGRPVLQNRGWVGRPGWGGRPGWAGRPGWGGPGWVGRPGWGRPVGWGGGWGYAPGWGGAWGPGWGFGGAALATGVIIGSEAAAAPGPVSADWVAYCARRYRSYDPRSGTFLGYDGRRHSCP
ncbi:BA14K family protein [Xanthobacter sp. DSM 24535]|uniref:BA14K family protein n=1 Tax=Roseixanthobacter psychrophilus TaxID=3119917 RepID=UPI00372B6E54